MASALPQVYVQVDATALIATSGTKLTAFAPHYSILVL